ncbi:hypothetical protein [uncultured Porphyromonas sp.]|uniref:hypothetical protein n=1 Tax=uncultured Porphyromonas sp. TaxID=159274 RepID=UPI0026115718|nr:hypothetical protein [uncultured Porphyromonas sp.]
MTQRTHRSCVPTKGYTYHRYTYRFDTTDAVTFDTTDAQIVRPYKGLHVSSLHVPL